MKKGILVAAAAILALAAILPSSALADKAPKAAAPELNTEDHMKYMNGYNDGTFRPDALIKRSEVSKLISGLLKEKNDGRDYLFIDVPADSWYYEHVSQLTGYNLIAGYEDNTFRPDNTITRAEFVTILSRLPHTDLASDTQFTDVPKGHWAYNAVQIALGNNWVSGYEGGVFKPSKAITRAEAVTILNRVLGRKCDTVMASSGNGIMVMPDVPLEHWAYFDMLEATTAHNYTKANGNETWTDFEKNTSVLEPGWHNINGELFHVNAEKQYDRNTNINGLELDHNGRYTTGSAELDMLLTSAAKAALTGNKSQPERLRQMYDYAKNNFGYLGIGTVDTNKEGWDIEQATLMLKNKKGNCYSWGSAFTHLARKAGYPAKAIPGKSVAPNGAEGVHVWTEIEIDGMKFTFDPQIEKVYADRYDEHYDLYMKQYGETEWGYKKNEGETSGDPNTPSGGEQTPEADPMLVGLMKKVYGTVSTEGLVQTVLCDKMGVCGENIEWFTGVRELELESGLASEPMINAIPHSVVLLKMKDGADVEGAKAKIKANLKPNKWVCVGVEDENFIVESVDNIILIAMDDENAQAFLTNFKLALASETPEAK